MTGPQQRPRLVEVEFKTAAAGARRVAITLYLAALLFGFGIGVAIELSALRWFLYGGFVALFTLLTIIIPGRGERK